VRVRSMRPRRPISEYLFGAYLADPATASKTSFIYKNNIIGTR
jgi:hypothetical protein